jgi:hypothetical protein
MNAPASQEGQPEQRQKHPPAAAGPPRVEGWSDYELAVEETATCGWPSRSMNSPWDLMPEPFAASPCLQPTRCNNAG